MRDGDGLLIVWVLAAFALDVFLCAGTAYVVFWKGHSGWWWLLAALMMSSQPTLFKVLRRRFGVDVAEN